MEAVVKEAVKRVQRKTPKQLHAMRRALKTRDAESGSSEVRTWRQLLREDPKAFLGHLARLEAAFQAQKGKGSEAGKPPPAPEKMDEGTERVLALLAELKGGGG